MQPFTVKHFRNNRVYPPHAFYLLSKGNNTGRPSRSPNTNAFVLICQEQDADHYYRLVCLLWESGQFRSRLRGSVILFIPLPELRSIIIEAAASISRFQHQLHLFQQFTELAVVLQQQLFLVQLSRQQLMQQLIELAA